MNFPLRRLLFFAALTAYAFSATNRLTLAPLHSGYLDNFNMYFMPALFDRTLFPADGVVLLFRRLMEHPLLREFPLFYFYGRASQLVPIQYLAKAVSFLLALGSAELAFRTGRRLFGDDRPAFLFSAVALICFLSMDSFYFGQNRSFGAFLFFAFVWLAASGRYAALPPFVYLFYLFYPYLALPAALASAGAFFLLPAGWRNRRLFLAAGLVSLALTVATDIGMDAAIGGAGAFSYKLTGFMGEPVLPGNPLHLAVYYFLNANEHSRLYVVLLAALAAASALGWRAAGWRAPEAVRRAAPPLAPFLVSFALVYPFSPLMASRETVFAVPYLLCAGAAAWAEAALGRARLGAAALGAAALFAVGQPYLNEVEDMTPYTGLYEELRALPKDAMIAADPAGSLPGGIPYYSGRQVFYNDITAEVLSAAAPLERKEAMRAAEAAAVCAADPSAAAAFAAAAGVTHFLVEPRQAPGGACGPAGSALYRLAASGRAVLKASTPEGEVFLLKAADIPRGEPRRRG